MKRFLVAGAAVLVAAVVAIPTLASANGTTAKHDRAAKKGGWIVCREHPVLHISPPLTLSSPQPATFAVSDVLESCNSSDPTIDRGIAVAKFASSAASCMGGPITGVARIRWNNGRTTMAKFSGSYGGGFAMASGQITGGSEFLGQPFAGLDKLNIDAIALQLCQSPMGLSMVAADGQISIGKTSILGAAYTP